MIRRTLCSVATVVLLAGCGADPTTPSDAVPQLTETLTAVDRALAEHRYPAARRHLADLVDTTEAARRDGRLQDDQADQVLAAAARLLAALPGSPRRGSTPSAPSTSSEGGSTDDDEEAKKLEEERKKLEEERKKLEKERQKEEGGGKDGSGENGPDDGHGN